MILSEKSTISSQSFTSAATTDPYDVFIIQVPKMQNVGGYEHVQMML